MKRLLPLFILSSFLFGQDVLTLKNGDFKRGKCDGKSNGYIIFQIDEKYKKYRLDKVESIEIDNKKYYYPFNLPITSTYKYQGLSTVSKNILLGYAAIFLILNMYMILHLVILIH